MSWDLPSKLFHYLKTLSLGAFRIVGPHIHVYKCPIMFAGNLCAETVHFIVVPLYTDHVGIIYQRIYHFTLLKVVWNENKCRKTCRRRVGRYAIGKVAG